MAAEPTLGPEAPFFFLSSQISLRAKAAGQVCMWCVDDLMTGFCRRRSERNDEVAVSGSQGVDFQITDPT